MSFKQTMKKLVLGEKSDSASYIRHLRKIGVKIGEDCTIYVPSKTLIDEQYPWMVTIGSHVRITEGVKILTHDYSWSVLKGYQGSILGSSGPVKIGDNVFIGMNSVILRSVEIGDNVIIGAGSVVSKNCEANSVYAGVPAKRIMSIEEFLKRRENYQREEAKHLALAYFERFGKKPEREIFHEYFMLFETAESAKNNETFMSKLRLCNNESVSVDYMKDHKPQFQSFEAFLQYCFEP